MSEEPKAEAKAIHPPTDKPGEARPSEAKPADARSAESRPAAPPGANPMLLVGAVALGLALGVTTGTFLVAPRVLAARSARPAAADEKAAKERGGGAHGEKDRGKKGSLFRVDNIVVNPSGSQGTRFLMVSVAFEVPDEKAGAELREHEVEVRDAVISTLESQTLERLTRPGARDSLKRRLAAAVTPMTAGARWLRVYLPQFVIQ